MKLVTIRPTDSRYTVTTTQRRPNDHHELGNRSSTQHQRVGSPRSMSCNLMSGQFSCSPDSPRLLVTAAPEPECKTSKMKEGGSLKLLNMATNVIQGPDSNPLNTAETEVEKIR
ncbi:unnamed protein product [Parnassius apollo]|uniref:(apollo) hypothetical protein n=1 Tax=Parnassius apollo TaxID=110799 RepID=A0A8S3X7Q7_PARAO|nr:unnamed protein product [Parnassius apollo]